MEEPRNEFNTHRNLTVENDGAGIVSTIDEVNLSCASIKNLGERILSGDPRQICFEGQSLCGSCASGEVAESLSKKLNLTILSGTSNNAEGSGHIYLNVLETDQIIDPTAGMYIPPTARIGFEMYFKGNMYIGDRKTLKNICKKTLINTSSADNPEEAFSRIWGKSTHFISYKAQEIAKSYRHR